MSQNIVPVFPVYFIWGLFKRIFNTIFLCLFLPIFSFAAGNFQKGYEAHLRGDFSAAIKAWGPLAAQGDAAAQFNIGNLFDFGKGVREDNVQAAYWYNKSAEQDNVNAQYALGWMYENGEGVKKDLVKALLWYKKAADQKHSGA
ncbi:MAG: sel1 repeat family protein, partial [Deltaproteobacteria bacterium]|nr:sel1 repeat family protein [Deltaproteobacteria bacterium]